MIEQTWQDKTDDTLQRIESQSDGDSERQVDKALDFREKVIVSLTKIEYALDQNTKDHVEIKEAVAKIPKMEIGLNNHLSTHSNIKNYVYYPILVAIILSAIGLFCKLILHAF